jgi:hypothetical protein
VIQSYRRAFERAQSLTYRVISAADHALSEKAWQQTYTSLLVAWMNEMVLGARGGKMGPPVETPHAHSVQPTPADTPGD